MNLLQAMGDVNLFGRQFSGPSWGPWRAFIATLFGLPVPPDQLELARECTGLSEGPSSPVREAWVVAGRRAGKSRIFALIAVYLATFRDWSSCLAPGERGYVLIIAAERQQTDSIMNFIRALLKETPLLAPLIAFEGVDEIALTNGITFAVATRSHRAVRSKTVIAALLDEVGVWQDAEASSNSDAEVLAALLPAMATIPNSLLLAAGSPYGRRGVLWRNFERYLGKPGPVLVWHAPSRVMNPLLPISEVERAYAADPARAAAEYDAQFRDSASNLIDADVLQACIAPGVVERERVPGRSYFAFVDAADGRAGGDSMVLAIAHREERVAVLDLIREVKPPFSPERVVTGFARILQTYGLRSVQADRHGRGLFADSFCATAFPTPPTLCRRPTSMLISSPAFHRARSIFSTCRGYVNRSWRSKRARRAAMRNRHAAGS